MKLTFVYDGILFQDDDGKWYGRNYADLYMRYSLLSDDITYMMRTRKESNVAKKMNQMPENTKVISVPDIMNIKNLILKRKETHRIISKQISDSDCVVVRLPGIISRIALKYAKKYNKPCIVEVVGCVWDSLFHHSLKGKIMAPLEFVLTRRAIINSKYVCYVTNEFLQKRYPTKGKFIGVSDVQINPIEEMLVSKKRSERDIEDTLIIGTAGAVDIKYKGHEYVIKALSELKKNDVKILYRIAGNGNKSRLESIAKKYNVSELVQFDGSIPHNKMNSWYDSLDIYIQPSTVEGLPRALLEAMSRGIACVGSNVGGIPELLSKDCLFNIGDVNQITSIIKSCKNDWLKKVSIACLDTSLKYQEEVLRRRRNDFYKEFIKDQGW